MSVLSTRTGAVLGAAVLLAACASVPDRSALLPARGAACIEQRPAIAGRDTRVRWCIASQMFGPRRYDVRIGDQVVFDGDDYRRVRFTRASPLGEVQGHCDERVVLIDSKTDRPMRHDAIPKTMVEACRIEAGADGLSRAFVKSEACDGPFYKDLAPMLGPVLPVETRRACRLTLNGQQVFDGQFLAERRF